MPVARQSDPTPIRRPQGRRSADGGDFAVPTHVRPLARLKSLDDLDGRTKQYRDAKVMIADLIGDLGGADRVTTAERALVERAALLSAMCQHLEATWLAGNKIFAPEYASLTNTLRRVLLALGLERRPRDVSPGAATERALAELREASRLAGDADADDDGDA